MWPGQSKSDGGEETRGGETALTGSQGTGEGSKGAEGTSRAGPAGQGKTPSLAGPVAPVASRATFVNPAFRLRLPRGQPGGAGRHSSPCLHSPGRREGASSAKKPEGKALCGSASPSPTSLTSHLRFFYPFYR